MGNSKGNERRLTLDKTAAFR